MRRLLFIEDESAQRELTEQLYQMCAKCFHGETEFLTAPSWETGLAIIRAQQIDVLILDLVLPPMNRNETLEAFRAALDLPPVVVLTNATEDGLREKVFAHGASDFMSKREANRRPEELCERCYNAFLRRKYERAS